MMLAFLAAAHCSCASYLSIGRHTPLCGTVERDHLYIRQCVCFMQCVQLCMCSRKACYSAGSSYTQCAFASSYAVA
jgi:hypothetical protein